MPDSFEHMPTVGIRMPNGALTSLAGNIDPHHQIAVADLILVPKHIRETVTRLLSDFKRKKLITVKGSNFFVLAREQMQSMVSI